MGNIVQDLSLAIQRRRIRIHASRHHAPSSTLYSNVVEMANWLRMNLSRGTWDGVAVLNGETLGRMWAPTVRTGWGGYDDQVGLPW